MSAETTTPPLSLRPSPAVVNALLKWSAEDRERLAELLLDSVREGFTSLEEVEQRDKDMIRERIEAYERGEIKAIDADEMFRRIDAKLAELRRK
jgi:putative addiction module component (TIGR02574 family)